MNIATHILLAADFSVASDAAVDMAGELARSLDAKLTILNIHKPPPEPPEAAVPPERLVWSSDLDDWSQEALVNLKNTRLADIEGVILATTERGSPDRGICDYAGEYAVDLIVLGSHARGGLAHFFLGSVAEKVVKHAPCPVLVIPSQKNSASEYGLARPSVVQQVM